MTTQQRDAIEAVMRARPFDPNASLEQRRADSSAVFAARSLPGGTLTESITLGGRSAVRVTPRAVRTDTTVLYVHGGGYIVGSGDTGKYLAAAIGVRAGTSAVSLDYRLAPEHRYPAALDDALAAYRELLETGSAESIVVAGDSAGGGLTLALLLAARAEGLPQPSAAVLFSPFADPTATGTTVVTHAGSDPVLSRATLQLFADAYLGRTDPRTPLASPVFADLSGLPPLLIQVGTHEILLDDALRLARQAALDDVSVTLDVVAGMPHVFQSNQGNLDEADAALDRAAAFIVRARQSERSCVAAQLGMSAKRL